MKIGISSYVYRWSIGVKGYLPTNRLSALDVVRRAASFGCGSVQLCDHLDLGMNRTQVEELNSLASDCRISLELGLGSTDPAYLVRSFDLARKLGVFLVRVVPDVHRESRYMSVEQQLDDESRRIGAAIREFADPDLVIALENHAGLLSAELVSLVQQLDSSQVGVCLDTMNSVALLEAPEQTIELLAPFARTVHLKDFRIVSSPQEHVIRGTVLGEGILPFPRFVQELRRSGKVASFHIEHYLSPAQAFSDTIQWEDEAVKRSIDYAVSHLGFERVDTGGF
ncbi:MAG: sugar phosphate isomerase/epimerase family protein [Spirochaetota bacterium]